MVNVTYTPQDSNMIATAEDGTVYYYNMGDLSWIMACTALVMIMSPGLGFFYSGLLRRKNALSMIYVAFLIFCVVSVEWIFWGYSLTFSPTGSAFIGDLSNFGMINVDILPSAGGNRIPALLYAVYQMMFATITPIIAFGASAERGRLAPILVLTFCWSTIVYNPIAHWIWSPLGWDYIEGGLDYAGGGPVHISSGTAALAYSLYVGKRRGYGTSSLAVRPSSTANAALGTALLWFGWFGFNGGSAAGATLRAIQSMVATNTAAAFGGIVWLLMDWRIERKWSLIGMCSGIVAGLVGITPAAGFVGTPSSLAIGGVTAVACNLGTKIKFWIHVDDSLDVFAVHGIGGMVGALLTGIFADSRVTSFDGLTEIPGGWINHYIQLGYQLAGVCAVFGYSFVMTMLLCFLIDHVPGLHLRATEEAEIVGIDVEQMGEVAYDYVHHRRDVGATYDLEPYDSNEVSSQKDHPSEKGTPMRETPAHHTGRAQEMTEAV